MASTRIKQHLNDTSCFLPQNKYVIECTTIYSIFIIRCSFTSRSVIFPALVESSVYYMFWRGGRQPFLTRGPKRISAKNVIVGPH